MLETLTLDMFSNGLQLPYHAESLGASSSPLSAEVFEGLILVGWHLCPPGFAMNILFAGATNPP